VVFMIRQVAPSLAKPMAIMMWKLKKTMVTGGSSASGMVSSPASGAFRSCFRTSDDSLGISSA
jgi:hypothetical protein